MARAVAGVGHRVALRADHREEVDVPLGHRQRALPVPVAEVDVLVRAHLPHEGEVRLEGPWLAGEVLVERVGEEVGHPPRPVHRLDVHQPQILLAAGDGEQAQLAAHVPAVHRELDLHQRLGAHVRPAREGDGGGGEALAGVGEVALPVQHLEDARGAAVEEERVVELGRDGAGGVVERLRGRHGDGHRPEVGAGDLEHRRLGQRGEGADQQAEDQDAHRGVRSSAGQGRNISTTPYFCSGSRRWGGGGEKGAARFTAPRTACRRGRSRWTWRAGRDPAVRWTR